jgi:hypothetical protein
MLQETPTDTAAADRPHSVLRCVAGFFAVLAAAAIGLMVVLTVQNWEHVPADQARWVALAMLTSMLVLLWSGVTLVRRWSNLAFVAFVTSALLGLPFNLIVFAIALSD